MKISQLKSLIKNIIRECMNPDCERVCECCGARFSGTMKCPKCGQDQSQFQEVLSPSPLQYKFHDYNWLGNMAGFGVPTDVHYGSIYLGTIESEEDGYKIVLVDTPHGKKKLPMSDKNKFKSKNQAAETLHGLWRFYRTRKIS